MTMNERKSGLLQDLKTMLKGRGLNDFDNTFLMLEINNAIGTINRCRNFTPTDDCLYDSKYEYLIVPMCVYSLSKIGAEGESSHTENGIVRKYDSGDNYPTNLLKQIVPLIKR